MMMAPRMIEERPGFPGPLRAKAGESVGALPPRLNNLGGHVGAPRLD